MKKILAFDSDDTIVVSKMAATAAKIAMADR